MAKYQHTDNSTLTQTIIDYIRNHPDVKRSEIIEGIGYEGSPVVVSNCLSRLQREQVLKSNGGRKHCRWEVIDDKTLPMFLEMAEDILHELKYMHPSVRVVHLAQRLEDLLGETIDEDLES